MIDEDKVDEILERARALGTDYDVIADILGLVAEVRRLHAPVEAAGRLKLQEAEQMAEQQRDKVTEAELETALKKARTGQPSPVADGSLADCVADSAGSI